MVRDARRRPPGRRTTGRGRAAALALGAALAAVAARLLADLGASTAVDDGLAWGLWEPIGVAGLTGAGAGALALSLAVRLAGRGQPRALVRSAAALGAVTYALAGLAALVDLGRSGRSWALLAPPWWNPGAVLLAATLCAMACWAVPRAEVAPARPGPRGDAGGRRRAAERVAGALRRLSPVLLGLSAALTLLHQASLGSLLRAAGTRLHPLWQCGWLPALFLLSSLGMGAAAVIALHELAPRPRARDPRRSAALGLAMAGASLAFVALRLGDLAWTGALRRVDGWRGVIFLAETFLLLYPAIRLLRRRYRENPGLRLWAALLVLAGGGLYRLDVFLGALDPGAGWIYLPSPGEVLACAGLVAAAVAGHAAATRHLPALAPAAPPPPRAEAPPATRRAGG